MPANAWLKRLPLWVLLLTLAMPGWGAARAAAVTPVPDSIAEVNGVPILRRSFQIDYRQAVDKFAQKGNPVNEAHLRDLRARLIDYLVETELLYQDARRVGIQVSDRDLAADRARFANEDQFRGHLQTMDMSVAEYRERCLRDLTIKRLIETRIARDITVSDQEIQDYYQQQAQRYQIPERLHVRHITLRFPPAADATRKSAVRDRILDIRRQINAGQDFAELALRFSEDPNREKGGDAGFLDAGQPSRTFGQKVLEISTGQVSEPLETPQAYHLVTIEARQPSRTIPLVSVREGIRRQLYRQKTIDPIREHVKVLRHKARIVIHE
ncbi:MAG: peptidylprolyl isomerase [Desulfosarcina sp.]|nr:peptidylprolyl isomerase [Desulfobacterales bacterium]